MAKDNRNGPRFRTDDRVRYSPEMRMAELDPAINFVIVTVMPRDSSGSYSYRIKPVGTGPSRVALEAELKR